METSALEALERIKEFYPQWHLYNRNDFNTIETALKRLELFDEIKTLPSFTYEELQKLNEEEAVKYNKVKAFGIVKIKSVNILYLKECDNAYEYNELIKPYFGMARLTQEEFDTIKGALM